MLLWTSPTSKKFRHLRNSRFLDSRRLKMERKNETRKLDLDTVRRAIRLFRQKIDKFSRRLKQPMSVYLCGGTLLGEGF